MCGQGTSLTHPVATKMAAPKNKHVSVEFVGNDEVIRHIIPVEENFAMKPKRSKVQTLADSEKRPVRVGRKSVSYNKAALGAKEEANSPSEESEDEDEEEEENTDELSKTPEVLLDGDGVRGADVYQFKKNKRTGQMAQVARQSMTPVSARRQPKQLKTRVVRRSRRLVPDSDDDSESSKASSSDDDSYQGKEDNDDICSSHSTGSTSTPLRRGKRNATHGGRRGQPPRESAVKTPSAKRKTRGEVDLPNLAEEYFTAQSGQSVTSDHTLARLAIPQMDSDQVHQALSGAPKSYNKEVQELYREYKDMFNKWMFQLSHGFNLMLYGLGSKRRLLDMFRAEMLSRWSHVVVNGFFPGLTVKSILNSITDGVLEHETGFRSLAEQSEFIRDSLEEREDPVFLIIHNIDGVMLRGHKSQSVLSSLAQLSSVHIIATIDHINAPLIWDQAKSSSFYWMWYDVTTYEPYTEETSYENSLLVQQSGVLALSSLTHVLRSLTPNARGIFNLLVEYQLSHQEDATYQGLSLSDLYQKCREAFLVNSELTLRAQLTEFRDHKLIRSKKGLDGVEFLLIAVDTQTLLEFQQQEEV